MTDRVNWMKYRQTDLTRDETVRVDSMWPEMNRIEPTRLKTKLISWLKPRRGPRHIESTQRNLSRTQPSRVDVIRNELYRLVPTCEIKPTRPNPPAMNSAELTLSEYQRLRIPKIKQPFNYFETKKKWQLFIVLSLKKWLRWNNRREIKLGLEDSAH